MRSDPLVEGDPDRASFVRAGIRIPDVALRELERHFELSGMSREAFFSHVFADWEYELLYGKEEVSSWSGYLGVLNQGVPAQYADDLEPRFGDISLTETRGFGCSEVIALYEANVPTDYALALDRAGVTDVADIISMYLTGVPIEYAVLVGDGDV